jgi:bifunctional non-homologous end joining protein LigD
LDLMRRRGQQYYYAFDVLRLDGRDLRGLPLIERKLALRALVPLPPSSMLFIGHVAAAGTALFQAVCERDMEGIVAKFARGFYRPDETTWVKIRNPRYSQWDGRRELFEHRRDRMRG